jgi:hypothetical protein
MEFLLLLLFPRISIEIKPSFELLNFNAQKLSV